MRSATVQMLFSTPAAIARGHADCTVHLAKVVICEIQRNRSLKVFQLFAESIRQAGKPSAMHSQGVVLLFNVRRGNRRYFRLADNRRPFSLHHFGRAIPTRSLFEVSNMGDGQGFYHLAVIDIFSKHLRNRLPVGRKTV